MNVYKQKIMSLLHDDSVFVLIATVINSFFSWAFISCISKHFGSEIVGIYSGVTAIVVPVITFGNFSLRSIQVTDSNETYHFSDFFYIKILTSILSCIIIFFLTINKWGNKPYILTLVAIMIKRIVGMYSDVSYGEYIHHDRISLYCKSMVFISVSCFFVFLTGITLTKKYELSLLASSLPAVLFFLFYDAKNVHIKKELHTNLFSMDRSQSIIQLAFPLACVTFINTLYDSVPKYFIEYYHGFSDLGIFAATSYVSTIAGLIVTSITTVYTPKLAMYIQNGMKKEYKKILKSQVLIIAVICGIFFIIFSLVGKQIITILYTEEYASHMGLIFILLLASFLNCISRIFGSAATAARYNKEQLLIALFCVLICCISSVFLCKKYDMIGAAFSIVLVYLTKIILLLNMMKYKLRY
jgi:O-antigen/teichoic acid export membrane protein